MIVKVLTVKILEMPIMYEVKTQEEVIDVTVFGILKYCLFCMHLETMQMFV